MNILRNVLMIVLRNVLRNILMIVLRNVLMIVLRNVQERSYVCDVLQHIILAAFHTTMLGIMGLPIDNNKPLKYNAILILRK